ncbi:MAG: AAA family ATPase [Actinomycetota bacterium]
MAANVATVLRGKDTQIRLALVALCAEGHVLVEDVPGVGKTSLARAIAGSIGGKWSRVQFTPDLLPSDVTGVSIWNQATREFEFQPGPVFANIVVGDEINRASPKTQSALLEVMEERQVTVDGSARPVPTPFLVLATQNPIDMEGTYNLPEAQLDRFLIRMAMGYPDRYAEEEIVMSRHGRAYVDPPPVTDVATLRNMIDLVRLVYVAPELVSYAVAIVAATRQSGDLRLGSSPRGSLGLVRAAQSFAASEGRQFATAEDVKRLVGPVLGHRLLLSPDAQLRGVTTEMVLDDAVRNVVAPNGLSRV